MCTHCSSVDLYLWELIIWERCGLLKSSESFEERDYLASSSPLFIRWYVYHFIYHKCWRINMVTYLREKAILNQHCKFHDWDGILHLSYRIRVLEIKVLGLKTICLKFIKLLISFYLLGSHTLVALIASDISKLNQVHLRVLDKGSTVPHGMDHIQDTSIHFLWCILLGYQHHLGLCDTETSRHSPK